MTTQQKAAVVLKALFETPQHMDGESLKKTTQLDPEDLNDAIDILEGNSYVRVLRWMGTTPYRFGEVKILPRGKVAWEEALASRPKDPGNSTTPGINEALVPAGSPFGFEDEDWEYVTSKKKARDKLKVVVGYQFKSTHYDSDLLIQNLKRDCQTAIDAYNAETKSIKVVLDFRSLAAGYGEHLFNQIARDIISADIAIFETSDRNPNVMIEMGVALTWGVRVLPIKSLKCEKPPSDISGQTYASYIDGTSAGQFDDSEHKGKLLGVVERAARKKL